MPSTLPNSADRAHLLSSVPRAQQAKVHNAASILPRCDDDQAKVHNAAPIFPGCDDPQAKVHGSLHGNPAFDWVVLGRCVDEVRQDARLNVDEFAHALGRGPRQVGKWLSGTERPQIEIVLAVERFQVPMLLALARRVRSIEITTQLTARRPA